MAFLMLHNPCGVCYGAGVFRIPLYIQKYYILILNYKQIKRNSRSSVVVNFESSQTLITTSEDKRLKIIKASQSYAHRFKNLKRKRRNCNANSFCHQECPRHKLIPNYARTKILHTSKAFKQSYNRIGR